MKATVGAKPRIKGLDNYSKGGIFEWYVVRLFNRQHFRLQEWRRSKRVENPQYLVDRGFPDMEWNLVFSDTNDTVLPWNVNGGIGPRSKNEWANKDKIVRYIHFQRSTGITVFVAIGVGGQPGSPEKVFVMALDEISGNSEVREAVEGV